jgi:hypothetical protein
MVQIVLVGLGAGAAAALLFASVVSGSFVAVFLFYLAPLPILIAALGWSHLAGLIAAASATAVIAIVSGAFLIVVPTIAFGAWWLGYLALLARPSTNDAALEWYPVGRLVLWAAVIGTLVVAAAMPHFGTDLESLQAALRKIYERLIAERLLIDRPAPEKSLIDLLVIAVPPAAAVFSTIINLVNLWLAARVVNISGRLTRPWPDIAALTLPPAASGLLAAAIAGSFLPDLFGVLASAFAASLLLVFAILGLAVMHVITRGMNGRTLVLAGTYAAAIVIGWPVLMMSVLGLVETLFNMRDRIARKRGPPTLPT